MNVLRQWNITLIGKTSRLTTAEQCETRLDVLVIWVELGCTLISIQSVVGLVITRFVL